MFRAARFLSLSIVAVALAGCSAETGDSVAASSAEQTAGHARIHASAGYQQASAADQAKIDRLAESQDSESNANLADVLEGDASRLFDTDKDGASTLDNLVALFTQAMHPKIEAMGAGGFTTRAVRDAVMADIAHPGNIHQGHFNTCQITNLEYGLATAYPSEYVRLMRGLTGASGKVKMRKGDDLALYANYLTPKSNDDRSASEAIFQTAVMDHITGSYDPQKDESKLLFVPYPGNSTHMAKGTFEQLFGVSYEVKGESDIVIVFDHRATMDTDEAKDFLRRLPLQRAPAMVDAVLVDVTISHSLFITKLEGDRVFFRNPWGPNDLAEHSGQLEDASESIYSMTIDELAPLLQTTIAPR